LSVFLLYVVILEALQTLPEDQFSSEVSFKLMNVQTKAHMIAETKNEKKNTYDDAAIEGESNQYYLL